ncbi:MAG: hypothetical protein ACK5JM_00670 [Rhodoblastus sp.]
MARLLSAWALPRAPVGKRGSILKIVRPSAGNDPDSSPLPFGSGEAQCAVHANSFQPRFQLETILLAEAWQLDAPV